MIEYFFSEPKTLQRYRGGPLGRDLTLFAKWLVQSGYRRTTGQEKLRIVSHLNQWFVTKQFEVNQLDGLKLRSFQNYRKRVIKSRHGEMATLTLFLRVLRDEGRIAQEPCPAPSVAPRDRLVRDYGHFLSQERNLADTTVRRRLPVVRDFLSYRFGSGRIIFSTLGPRDVTRFVSRAVHKGNGDHARLVATTVRSFLAFLFQIGQLPNALHTAVPRVATQRLPNLPRYLEAAQVETILMTCDRSTDLGRRDFAILLLLARLGLRGHEVRLLKLEDIRWETGEILIRGKCEREDRMPLPPDVGQAIASYLKQGRPRCSARHVFLRLPAPPAALTGPTVSAVVERAIDRAGISSPHKGSHLLRHSLATRMLRGGATLWEIGQILRHKRIDTTEIYARVDQAALRLLAQPWPGGVR